MPDQPLGAIEHVGSRRWGRVKRLVAMWHRRRFDLVLYALVLISAGGGCILVFVPKIQGHFNDPKAWEITTQFVFVTIFGGLIALLYKRSEQERELRRAQRASLEEFYRDAVAAYHECKKIRRTLSAFSIRGAQHTQPWQIERACYEKLMDGLEDVQLKMERMIRDVTSREYLFSDKQTELNRELTRIEKYLNHLLDHYEQSYAARRIVEENMLINLEEPLRVFVESQHHDPYSEGSRGLFEPAKRMRELVVGLIERLHL